MKRFSIVILAALFVFAGCGEDKATTPTSTAPTVPTITLQTPITNTTDANALQTSSMIQLFNALLGMNQAFAALPSNSSNGTHTWTYTVDGVTWTMTAVLQGDAYVWTYKVTGLVDGVQLNNFVMWTGTVSADGKTGTSQFFEHGTGTSTSILAWDLVWTTAPNGAMTLTYREYTGAAVTFKLVLTYNSDHSGSLDEYDNGSTLSFHAQWLANGTGTWTRPGSTPPSGSWD
jgi:hypothetical protein